VPSWRRLPEGDPFALKVGIPFLKRIGDGVKLVPPVRIFS